MRHVFSRQRRMEAPERSYITGNSTFCCHYPQLSRRLTAGRRIYLRAAPFSSPATQRGVMGIVAALTLTSAILFMVLALDSGRLYWEGQELQRLADLAALDAATANPDIFNGITLAGVNADPLQSSAEASAVANGATALNVPISGIKVDQGSITLTDSIRGFTDIASGGSDSFNDAIRVSISKNVCGSVIASLSALVPGGNYAEPDGNCLTPGFEMKREAVARRTAYVAFSAGTTLLSLCSDNSPVLQAVLGQLLSSSACLSLANASGILNERISLLKLSEGISALDIASSVGTLDGLLDADLSVAQLLDAALYALDRSSPNDVALLNAFESIAKLNIPNLDLLENMLRIQTPVEEDDESNVLDTEISLGELLNTAVLLANKCDPGVASHCISGALVVPSAQLNLHGLVNLSQLELSIIKPPVIAIGPAGCLNGVAPLPVEPGCAQWRTEATPAQIALKSNLNVNLGGLLSLNLNLNLNGVNGRAGISKVTKRNDGTGYNVSVGGYTSLLSAPATDPTENALSGQITLLSALQGEPSLVQNLLDTLLGGLLGIGVQEIVSINLPAVTLGPVSLSLAAGAGGEELQWPAERTTEIGGALNLSSALTSLLNTTSVTLNTISKQCFINLAGLCIPIGAGQKDISITITQLLPPLTTLVSLVGDILDNQLIPLLEALGVSINPMEVEVIDIQAGTPQLVI